MIVSIIDILCKLSEKVQHTGFCDGETYAVIFVVEISESFVAFAGRVLSLALIL